MFQSLGRDSECSSQRKAPASGWIWPFQSLGRDSECSSVYVRTGNNVPDATFQSLGRDSECSSLVVNSLRDKLKVFQSLGRDSECSSFPSSPAEWGPFSSFNPSVGILSVQAATGIDTMLGEVKFQSLGRDSECSSSSW